MSSLEDDMIDLEVRDSWWEQGEAVMKEMCEEEWHDVEEDVCSLEEDDDLDFILAEDD